MKYKYIAIEREYGSCGTQIGQELAKECGIPCYGREILEMISEKYHISVEQIEKYEEKATNSFLYSIALMGKIQSAEEDIWSREEKIYLEEQRLIKQLASEGPAVFVGRCASAALENQKNVLRVFIYADTDFRKENAIQKYGIAEKAVENVLKRYDRKRGSYYGANTGKNWKDWRNYDIILNSGKLGISGCVNTLKSLQ
ncbi:MAG: cytidylate kinase-like family protein [Lachnospiraceae bacterium]|nr:cytidylate kinase-like family protein [Robinsoniella sp.]MDY3767245.1 cytidylate kinase-like family protein [Lachnospiraceae bacterium]